MTEEESVEEEKPDIKYKCFDCDKELVRDIVTKRVRCIYCGSKILFKPRTTITHVKAR